MKTLTLPLILIFILPKILTQDENKLPDYINVCKRNDPEITKCWKKTAQLLTPHISEGLPELKIPKMDPFFIPHLQIEQGQGTSVSFYADLYNISVEGVKNVQFIDAKLNFNTWISNLEMFFPRLNITGLYKANGKVLFFEFNSEGKMECEVKNLTSKGVFYMVKYEKNQKEHVKIEKAEYDLKMEEIYFYLHDLFKNNPEITRNVNKIINENIQILYQEVKPLIFEIIDNLITKHSNRVYEMFPIDVLFPEN